jgi:hypothetical protein
METSANLMAARHEAYSKAKAGDFKNEADTKAWRAANREYVYQRRRMASQKPQSHAAAA